MAKVVAFKHEQIAHHIYFIRGEKIILDFDLAQMYGVETKYLKRQVNRNRKRFPKDFMFQLSKTEMNNLRCQFGTSSWGGTRYFPFAFTEQGVAMLSGILNSMRAITVNVAIMRAFVRLRRMIETNRELADKIEKLEKQLQAKTEKHDKDIQQIFDAIRLLLNTPKLPGKRIGYKLSSDEPALIKKSRTFSKR